MIHWFTATTDNITYPDYVNVPDHPGLPGGQRRVLQVIKKHCIVPGHDHKAVHYILEGPVSCCQCQQSKVFQWYRREYD